MKVPQAVAALPWGVPDGASVITGDGVPVVVADGRFERAVFALEVPGTIHSDAVTPAAAEGVSS